MARRRGRRRGSRRGRFRASVRRIGRRFRGRRHRSKPTPLGVKAGAAVMVLPPVVFPSIAAGQAFFSAAAQNTDIMTKIGYSAASALDTLAVGFGMGRPFSSFAGMPTVVNVPPNTFTVTTVVGSTLALGSAVQSWLARKFAGVKQVRVMNRRIA